MEFPITVESQDQFNELVKDRLAREKTKQADLESQVAALTAEKQDLATKLNAANGRAEAAEQWKTEREQADQHETVRAEVAKEFGIDAAALRGTTKEELTAHAEVLKPLLAGKAPVIPSQGNQPDKASTSEEAQFAASLFGGE